MGSAAMIAIGSTNIFTVIPVPVWGASHQTGWTGLVAKLIHQQGEHGTIRKLDPFSDL